jgi:hypothetical protein
MTPRRGPTGSELGLLAAYRKRTAGAFANAQSAQSAGAAIAGASSLLNVCS